jgi:hypothetical protein
MAIQSGEFVTSAAIGLREDLTNKIWLVSQQATPFFRIHRSRRSYCYQT